MFALTLSPCGLTRTVDWILQDILLEAPLMDGYHAAQKRVSNPGLTVQRKADVEQDRTPANLNKGYVFWPRLQPCIVALPLEAQAELNQTRVECIADLAYPALVEAVFR